MLYFYIIANVSPSITKNSTQFNEIFQNDSTKNKVIYLIHSVHFKVTNIRERKIILGQKLYSYEHAGVTRTTLKSQKSPKIYSKIESFFKKFPKDLC